MCDSGSGWEDCTVQAPGLATWTDSCNWTMWAANRQHSMICDAMWRDLASGKERDPHNPGEHGGVK